MLCFAFLLVPFLCVAVHAANDWSKPCLQGVCSYDLPASTGSASGTLKIWGSQDAISDITPAAGWMILGCAPDALVQDIRLVCNSDDTNAAGCDHLYQNIGAEGKIVRLPENCGKSAFARISKAWVPTDQSIPAPIAARLVRRDGSQPEVKALSLDTNFGAVDASKAGKVNIAIKGATVPGLDGDIVIPSASQRRSRLVGRGPLDFGDVGGALGNAGNAIVDTAKDAGNAVVDTAKDAGNAVVNAVDKAADAAGDANDFDVDETKSLPPINVNTKFNLFNSTISCPPLEASIKIDVGTKAKVLVNLGVAASGTIIPPNIDDFGITSDFSADLTGSLDFIADVSGTLDSGKIKIFEVGIPGLDFPGILKIGPSFEINAQAKAILDLNVDLKVGVNYNVKNARLVFPPKDKEEGGSFQISDTPLKLSASPSVTATGTVEAHLIPSLNFGISALGDTAEANVFVELDASAALELKLQAKAEANVTLDKNQTTADASSTAETLPSAPANKRSYYPLIAASQKRTVIQHRRHAIIASRAATTDTSASFGGCFDVKAGLDVNAGATAAFFGLFDAETKVKLFTKKFELFKKCFGAGVTKKRSAAHRSSLESRAGLNSLNCSKPDVGSAVSVADLALNAVNIKVVA